MRRIHVTEVIERDTDRILFAGHDTADAEQRVTFHLARPGADKVAAALELGDHDVEVEVG